MADDGRLRYVTKVLQASGDVERGHTHRYPCPCRDAYATGEAVRVTDLREESTRWPEFSAAAGSRGAASGRPSCRRSP